VTPATPTPDRRLRVFLCYVHEDRDAVLELYQHLQADGFQPWMDKKDLLPGQNWRVEIPKQVQCADVFIVCLSAAFVKKAGYGQKEITLALDTADTQLEGSIFVIPLRLEDCTVPERLYTWQWGNLFEDDGYELLLRALRHRAAQLDIPYHPSTTPPAPVHQPDIRVPPVVQARSNPFVPVTIAEWRDEVAHRTEVFGTPRGYWCYVRPGNYVIGGWEPDQPVETIPLHGFWIAKYPIIVQQYRHFIHNHGYTTRDYWTPAGWKWRQSYNSGNGRTQPYWWDKERFNSDDNQPVVFVTWHEDTAFAAWLTAELASVLPAGSCIRLPTEAEWEAACAYDMAGHRRTYPWGEEEPDARRADSGKEWRTDKPSPIGGRPDGSASCGAQDMVGSVWEATSSSFDGYPSTGGNVVADVSPGSGDIPWRGGAWGNNKIYVRCAARFGSHPDNTYGSNGFRVVLSPCLRANVLSSES
jgi:formylglycine-generating enzyme required for sulfatase activity